MAYPQIIYDAGDGPVTLAFTYPPVEKAGVDENGADEYNAIRNDSYTSSGLVQVVLDRVETFRTLQMNFVPDEDVTAWSQFMLFAIQGFAFTYYPDADDLTNGIICILADTTWSPKWAFRTIKKFTLRLRLAAQGQDASGIIVTGGGGGNPPLTISVTSPNPGDFTVVHGLGSVPLAAIPVMTSNGLIRLRVAPPFDDTNLYLNATDTGLTALVYVFITGA